jgi:hypothetical protein
MRFGISTINPVNSLKFSNFTFPIMMRNSFQTAPRLLLVVLLMPGIVGCSDNSRQEIELGEAIVTRGLDAWQEGKSSEDLQALEDPIEFHDDDWAAGAVLTKYEILKTWIDVDQTPRCQVRLNVQYGSDNPREVICAYQVVREPKKIVARDPMS